MIGLSQAVSCLAQVETLKRSLSALYLNEIREMIAEHMRKCNAQLHRLESTALITRVECVAQLHIPVLNCTLQQSSPWHSTPSAAPAPRSAFECRTALPGRWRSSPNDVNKYECTLGGGECPGTLG